MDKIGSSARVFLRALACAVLVTAGGSVALAGDTAAAPQVEGMERVSIMTVDAHIMIEANGEVSKASIETKLTPGLAASLEQAMLKWRYEPVIVGGQARRANTGVRLALVAEQEGDRYKVRLDGVDYPDELNKSAILADGDLAPISAKELRPPAYPPYLNMRGVMGSVLLAIRVTPDGKAGDVMVVQSQLYEFNKPAQLSRRLATEFEKVATHAAKGWTFNVPEGRGGVADTMTVLVPVDFTDLRLGLAQGQWLSVRRTPKVPIRWLPASEAGTGFGLASSGGGMSQLGAGPKMLRDSAGTSLP